MTTSRPLVVSTLAQASPVADAFSLVTTTAHGSHGRGACRHLEFSWASTSSTSPAPARPRGGRSYACDGEGRGADLGYGVEGDLLPAPAGRSFGPPRGRQRRPWEFRQGPPPTEEPRLLPYLPACVRELQPCSLAGVRELRRSSPSSE
jgi:hypothetical protein